MIQFRRKNQLHTFSFSDVKHDLFESDISFSPTVQEALGRSKEDQPPIGVAMDAVRNREYLWITRTVPYQLTNDFCELKIFIFDNLNVKFHSFINFHSTPTILQFHLEFLFFFLFVVIKLSNKQFNAFY